MGDDRETTMRSSSSFWLAVATATIAGTTSNIPAPVLSSVLTRRLAITDKPGPRDVGLGCYADTYGDRLGYADIYGGTRSR